MSEVLFLSLEQVELLHQMAIDRFGGSMGTRDHAALESAVVHPQNVYFYSHGDVFDVAAAYCFHIAEAQAYLDGNKRTGVAAALTFLEGNGISTDFDSMPIHGAMIAIAEKRMGKDELAGLIRNLATNKI